MLALASPAAAQGPLVEGGENPLYGPARPSAESARLPRRERAVSFTREDILREDGRPGTRTRIVGSLPLAANAELNLGLISVAHAGAKEFDRRRVDPSREVVPPRSRIAAVGLSLRF
jgi:hypothetical protein